MTKPYAASAIACRLGVALALIVACADSPARAQSADLVLCDRLAADPSDPDKPADVKGTAEITQSDIPTAIRFCKVASGSSRRALFELGRAYAANQQFAEAIGAWLKAADKGSSSAMVELGVLYANRGGRRARRSPGAKNCSSVPRKPAIRAALPISRRSPVAARRPIQPGPAPCWRKPPRPMPKRSISSE